jgi:23S rRNA (guanosine2251-2'-O)-methyltransferase
VSPKERRPGPKVAGHGGHFGRHRGHGGEHHAPHAPRQERSDQAGSSGRVWLYGTHAAKAALANPRRNIHRILATDRTQELLPPRTSAEILTPDAISRLLPQGSVHQGIALLCDPLPGLNLEDELGLKPPGGRLVAVLDQVTDPHNEGAILRSAAAFGVTAVIVQDRHAPPESGVLAKAASGALDLVPRIQVVNIARTLERLGRMGFWRIALDADGDSAIADAATSGDVALVLGAEGAGLRRLVREHCDVAAHIPIAREIGSLNVSNAAAIAFYELSRKTRQPG